MTKSDYLSNSAKLLMISSFLLLVTNAMVYMGAEGSFFGSLGQKLSTVAFYAVMVMGFLAFNGEGIGYKRSKEYGKKKRTTILKLLLIFAFLFRYVKVPVENLLLGTSADSVVGILLRFFLSMLNTIASYGFILMLASLWFLMRDVNHKGLFAVESVAFLCGVAYNGYKLLNYSVTKYGVTDLGELFTNLFSSQQILQTLCLLQFLCDGIMCVLVMLHYNKIAAQEHEVQKQSHAVLHRARNIYNTDCVGIDTLDDDFAP